MSSPSDGGIRVQLRMIVSAPPEQRYDSGGVEVLQIRGTVVDDHAHPEVVVRFSGPRRAELLRWARPDKHLGVDGRLEVKLWSTPKGPRQALLIEAQSLFPLSDMDTIDPSKAGIYATGGRTAELVPAASMANRVERMRTMLARDDV